MNAYRKHLEGRGEERREEEEEEEEEDFQGLNCAYLRRKMSKPFLSSPPRRPSNEAEDKGSAAPHYTQGEADDWTLKDPAIHPLQPLRKITPLKIYHSAPSFLPSF